MRSGLKLIGILSLIIWLPISARTQVHEQDEREKIYIQVDKPFYRQKDILRFNLTVLDAKTHFPTTISDIVYAELLDPKGSVLKKLTLPIFDGTAKGDFDLPDTGGLYHLKAYTSWSRNFDDINLLQRQIPVQNVIPRRLLIKPDFNKESYGPGEGVSFDLEVRDLKDEFARSAVVKYTVRVGKTITVEDSTSTNSSGVATIQFGLPADLSTVDALITAIISHRGLEESISRAIPIVLNNIDLKFYPEGGFPALDQESLIAFEATNEFGSGADIKGVIINDGGEVLTEFQSLHEGMGSFRMHYEKDRKYKARITSPAIEREFELPDPTSSPILILEKQSAESLDFAISGDTNRYHLEGFSRGKCVYDQWINGNRATVSTQSLPTGIVRFILRTQSELPLSERMVFVNKALAMKVEIQPDREIYRPGDQVKVKIKTKDTNGNPASMKLGIGVVDDQLISLADDKSDHILSYFFLSSELKGEIRDPKFYFDPEEEDADKALDLLMMVRGWSQYSWYNLQSDDITYPPERIRRVTGQLIKNDSGKPVQGYVYALETSEERRMIKVKTDTSGHFIIRNFNPKSPLYLFTKKPNKLLVDDDRAFTAVETRNTYSRFYENNWLFDIFIDQMEIETPEDQASEQDSFTGKFDLSLNEDVESLEEIVVVGYGATKKRNITGSVTQIQPDKIDIFPNLMALHGKVSGLLISSYNPDPSTSSNISFSHAKSLVAGNSTPLIVLNGFALSPSVSKHFLNYEIFTPDKVNYMLFMDSPQARLEYGTKGSNGIIFIETKSEISSTTYRYHTKSGKFNGVVIRSYDFSIVRDAYQVPKRDKNEKGSRTYLDHLVYWNPEVVTDENGETEITFLTNDQISNFRITAEGLSTHGNVGRGESTYSSSQSLSIDIKLPNKVGFEDQIIAEMVLTNESDQPMEGMINVSVEGLEVKYEKEVILGAYSRKKIPVSIRTKGISGTYKVQFSCTSGKYKDELERTIKVYPIGFPTTLSHSGSNPNGTFKFKITNAESGSLKSNFIAYPNLITSLESTAENLFREPHGCFEQVSATIYPSILALQYLQSTGSESDIIRDKALGYIKSGYKKLVGYEISGGGFEWFGHKPAHEGLTAFGLVEFTQMKKVYDGVEETMIKRTVRWLLSRRDSLGGFNQNKGKYGFSAASKEVNNAYIVYALSEAGVDGIMTEYENSYNEAIRSKDLYRMALLANSAFNLGEKEHYKNLVSEFEEFINTQGLGAVTADHSLVRSYGDNLKLEVVALWSLALLKSESKQITLAGNLIEFLLANRKGGYYGSTQATSLTLQAITRYNLVLAQEASPGSIEIRVNGNKRKELPYTGDMAKAIESGDFSSFFTEDSENVIDLKFPDREAKLPFYLSVSWLDKSPKTNDQAPVRLSATLETSAVKVNGTIRLNTKIENPNDSGLPMTIVRLGIPGGLSLQPWQLKEMQKRGLFDYYEIIDEDLVLYFKELGPEHILEIPFDLKAEIAGTYLGRASSAYLYYNDETKYWIPGVQVHITQ